MIYSIEYLVEKAYNLKLRTKFSMMHSSLFESDFFVFLFVLPVYTGVTALHSIRVLYKISFGFSFILFFEILVCAVELGYIITEFLLFWGFLEIFPGVNLKDFYSTYVLSTAKYIPIKQLYSLNWSKNFFTISLFYVLIFKVFSLISWFYPSPSYAKLFNAVYRSLMGLYFFFFVLIILGFTWTLSFFLIYRDYDSSYSTFLDALKTLAVVNIPQYEYHFEKYRKQSLMMDANDGLLALTFIISIVGKFLALCYLFVMICHSLRYAMAFEYKLINSKDADFQSFINENARKVDKFTKENLILLTGGSGFLNNKMIVWLERGLLKPEESARMITDAKEKRIKLIIFEEMRQVLDFLEFLFRLKPHLTYKSGNHFRILIELGTLEEESELRMLLRKIENLLDWLSLIGGRVPIIIYSLIRLSDVDIQYLKRIYPYTKITYDFQSFRIFGTTVGSIANAQTLQKKYHENEFEVSESEIFIKSGEESRSNSGI